MLVEMPWKNKALPEYWLIYDLEAELESMLSVRNKRSQTTNFHQEKILSNNTKSTTYKIGNLSTFIAPGSAIAMLMILDASSPLLHAMYHRPGLK